VCAVEERLWSWLLVRAAALAPASNQRTSTAISYYKR